MANTSYSPQQKRLISLDKSCDSSINKALYHIVGYIDNKLLADCFQEILKEHTDPESGELFERTIQIDFSTTERLEDLYHYYDNIASTDLTGSVYLNFFSSNDDNTHLLLWCSSLLLDNVSFSILLRETFSRYRSKLDRGYVGRQFNLSYQLYSEWYWENLLSTKEYPPVLFHALQSTENLGAQESHFSFLFGGKSNIRKTKAHDLTDEVNKGLFFHVYDRKHIEQFFLACWLILLSKVEDAQKITIGYIFNDRVEPFQKALGLYSKVLPITIDVDSKGLFREFSREVLVLLNKIKELNDYYFFGSENILNPLTDDVSSFSFVFEFFNLFEANFEKFSVNQTLENFQYEKFKAKLMLYHRNEQYTAEIIYDKTYYSDSRAHSLIACFKELVNDVLSSPYKPIGALRVVNDQRFFIKENTISLDQKKDMIMALEQMSQNKPDQIALILTDKYFTYSFLHKRSDKLMNSIAAFADIKRQEIIAIILSPSEMYLISILAIMKLQCVFLPINTDDPWERIDSILQDSKPKLIITDAPDKIRPKTTICVIDPSETDWSKEAVQKSRNVSDDELAYIIYTSGSNGIPKGVMIEYKSLNNLCFAINSNVYDQLSDSILRVGLRAPFHFDASLQQYASCLWSGNTLVMFADETKLKPKKFIEALTMHAVDVIDFTPSLFEIIVDELHGNIDQLGVKQLLVAGEKWSNSLLEKLFGKKQPATRVSLFNIYGPTECCVDSTLYDTKYHTNLENLPIGSAIHGYDIFIVDKFLQILPNEIIGEILIGGIGVGRGYLNRPELTYDSFVTNPLDANGRLYRTGDFGYRTEDGLFVFSGRKDSQVKRRGYRIELGEIERIIQGLSSVKLCYVANDVGGRKTGVVAFYVPQNELITDLRGMVMDRMPEYMIPDQFIAVEKIPLTPTGKVDSGALALIIDKVKTSLNTEKLLTATEKKLYGKYQNILRIENLNVDDDFFAQGGDSLKAMKLVSYIFKEFSLDLSIREVIKYSSIRGLAAYIDSNNSSLSLSIPSLDQQERYPLSSAQKRLWVLQKITNDSNSLNIQSSWEIDKMVDDILLKRALGYLVEKHQTLRTVFEELDGEPFQKNIPLNELDIHVDMYELSSPTQNHSHLLGETLIEIGRRTFSLDKGFLWRLSLLKIGNQRCVLNITMHHLIADNWSLEMFKEQLFETYSAIEAGEQPNGRKPSICYGDFSVWQSNLSSVIGEGKQGEANYAKLIPALRLPTDFARPQIKGFSGKKFSFNFDKTLIDAIRNTSKSTGKSIFSLLFATLGVAIGRWSKQYDFVLGTPITLRNHKQLKDVLGNFLFNTAIRFILDSSKTFADLIEDISDKLIEIIDDPIKAFQQEAEFSTVKRDISRALGFDIFVIYQQIEQNETNYLDDNRESDVNSTYLNEYDLTITFTDLQNTIAVDILYDQRLFLASSIASFTQIFRNALTDIKSGDLTKKITEIEILESKIVSSDEDLPFSRLDNTSENVLNDFVTQVENKANFVAVVCGDLSLTYECLDRKSSELSWRLSHCFDIKAGDIVGIYLYNSEKLLISIIAIWKLGAILVPLDINSPLSRVNTIIKDTGMKLLIAEKTSENLFRDLDIKVYFYLFDTVKTKVDTTLNKFENLDAYIIFTSGTTGSPKGVLINHSSLYNVTTYFKNNLHLCANDKWLAVSNVSFDISLLEQFLPITLGISVIICNNQNIDLKYLDIVNGINKQFASVLQATPTLLSTLFSDGKLINRKLNLILSGGEYLPDTLKAILMRCSDQLWNVYGPTETTIWSLVKKFNSIDEPSSIGKPIGKTSIYILDDNREIVPYGQEGTIFIGGKGLAVGYLNNPELTADKFTWVPFSEKYALYNTGDRARLMPNGDVEYLGRLDSQVKIAGHRVELLEVRSAVLSHPDIEDCVITVEVEDLIASIVCYYVLSKPISRSKILHYLKNNLPSYMVPDLLVKLRKIQMNSSGKVDYHYLKTVRNKIKQKLQPLVNSDIRSIIENHWKHVLCVHSVEFNQSFFELGGDSLKFVRLWTLINSSFEIEIELKDFFESITLGSQSNLVGRLLNVAIFPDNSKFSDDKFQLHLFPPMGGIGFVYNNLLARIANCVNPYIYHFKGLKKAENVAASFENYILSLSREIISVNKHNVIHLLGYSFGGVLAFETAKVLENAGFNVHLILIDSYPQQSFNAEEDEKLGEIEIRNSVEVLRTILHTDVEDNFLKRYQAVLKHYNKLFSHYKQNDSKLKGRITNFQLSYDVTKTDKIKNWDSYTYGTHDLIKIIDGDHQSILMNEQNLDSISHFILNFFKHNEFDNNINIHT